MSLFQAPGSEKARHNLPGTALSLELADFYKVFGDVSRIRILFALLDNELYVNEIADTLGMSQSAVSHQLRILRQNKLVSINRKGKTSVYSLNDDHVYRILTQGLEHLSE
ncbi:metalloregulator ArsR/SmtB family transcription factor [Dehalobacter sp. DCM]|uniref:ArsR/SmtB family transcription factor n=1 Tax=Dehalobacter sp. DCM TaxID=2907827 RepID=UPI003081C79A|nr:metalloregulator ArsR/SmtB family transcription factor [Dehalobacter sp. DCM]